MAMISSALRTSCNKELGRVGLSSCGVDARSVEVARGADDDASTRGADTKGEASCCKGVGGGGRLGVRGMRPRDFNAAA
jgi:hypothetical protein